MRLKPPWTGGGSPVRLSFGPPFGAALPDFQEVILLATDVKDLLQRLEDGVSAVQSSDEWRRLLQAQAKFHRYSLGNVCLILDQRPDATRVGGFHTWLSLGRHVKKGEHGIAILAPVFPPKGQKRPGQEPVQSDETEHVLRVEKAGRGAPVHFRVAYVFDVSQTEGDPLPEHPAHDLTGDSQEARLLLGRLVLLAEEEGLRVRYEDPAGLHGAKGYYQRATRSIVMAKGLAADHAAKTLVHELAHHFCGHGAPGDQPDRSREEAEAEGTAFVVCEHFGIETASYSFGYVSSWSGEEGPRIVKQVGVAIQKAARAIIERVEPEQVKDREIERAPRLESTPAMARER